MLAPEDLFNALSAGVTIPEKAPLEAVFTPQVVEGCKRLIRAEVDLPMKFFLDVVMRGVELEAKGFSKLATSIFSLAKIGMTQKQFETASAEAREVVKSAPSAKDRLMSTVQAPRTTPSIGLKGVKR